MTSSDLTKWKSDLTIMTGTHIHRDSVLGSLCDADTAGTPFSERHVSHQKKHISVFWVSFDHGRLK